jgi:hypothetical protein
MSASTSASTSFASASIAAPPQSLTHTTWSAPETHMVDPMDASFGYTLSSSRTHESRHDAARRQSLSADVPPPYDEEAAIPLPGYTLHAPEPLTLAMYLFKFGFRASAPCPRAHATFTHLVSFRLQCSPHSGSSARLSCSRRCASRLPRRMRRRPRGCRRRPRRSARRSSRRSARWRSSGRGDAYARSPSSRCWLSGAHSLLGAS